MMPDLMPYHTLYGALYIFAGPFGLGLDSPLINRDDIRQYRMVKGLRCIWDTVIQPQKVSHLFIINQKSDILYLIAYGLRKSIGRIRYHEFKIFSRHHHKF